MERRYSFSSMLCVNNHNFWKEIIAREERQLKTWYIKNGKPAEGCAVYKKPNEVMIYGNVLKQKTVKQRPVLFYGAGDMKTDEDDLNNVECGEYKRVRFMNEDSNDEEDKKLIFQNEDSKEVKYKRLRFGNEDLKENMRGLRKKNVAERKEKGKYNPRTCKLCQMAVYETPYKLEPEKCRECNQRVVYHCYRCCGCGCVPMDSRKVLRDEIPKMAQYEDGDDDELFQEYYDA